MPHREGSTAQLLWDPCPNNADEFEKETKDIYAIQRTRLIQSSSLEAWARYEIVYDISSSSGALATLWLRFLQAAAEQDSNAGVAPQQE